jgi:hypothetical protein
VKPFTGVCDRSGGLGIRAADNGTGSSNPNQNTYDVAFPIYVDNTIFDAPQPVDLTGTTITAGKRSISDLDVSVEYYFSTSVQAARIRVILENPTNKDIHVTIAVPVNLDSDEDTVIETTSSGDATLSAADCWVVTSDDGRDDQPIVTTVILGPGNPEATPSLVTDSVFDCDSSEGIGTSYDITVPARTIIGPTTRSLMFFAGLGDIIGTGNTVDGAKTNAEQFSDVNNLNSSLLQGLTNDQLRETLNWDFVNGTGGCGVDEGDGNIDDGDSSNCLLGLCSDNEDSLFGCSVMDEGHPDPTFALLLLLAAARHLRRGMPGRIKPDND